jgi:cytochrome P450 family 9
MLFPKLTAFLKVRILDQKVCDFFKETILDVMDEREKRGIVRHDLINTLIEARKGQLSHSQEDEKTEEFATVEESKFGKSKINRVWSDTDLAAQAFIFLLAGFDTVTTAMSFAAYELAVNPDVQEKLIQEIDNLKNEEITYEKIRDMKYMDQFISEVLRKWPPAPAVDRKCLKNYLLKYDDKSVVIEKGTMVAFPIIGFHYDPKYFPEPEKFDPKRFSDENKGNINLDVYLPFGIGPRNCIGSRFALMELKTLFFYLLSSFKFEVCEKTQIPLKYANMPFAVRAEKGIWLNLKPRVF